jgi:MFS family permease
LESIISKLLSTQREDMQSFLQYRRFRTTIQAQIARNDGRAKEGLSREEEVGNKQWSSPSPAASRKASSELTTDPYGHALRNIREESEEKEEVEQEPPEEADESASEKEEQEGVPEDRLSRFSTQQSERTALGRTLTGIEVRRRKTHEGGEGNVFVVGYEGHDDPMNPKSWSRTKRFAVTFSVASIGCVVGLASSIDSSAVREASAEFGVSEVVESMATGLFLIGFGAGALFAGPFSETLGRNPVYIVTLAVYMIFVMAAALSPNIGAQLAFRFIGGCFAATPLVCAGGTISDIWTPMERVYTFPIFAVAAFAGPLLGPVIGGFIVQSSYLSWRWVDWMTLIISAVVLSIIVLFQPETFPPILLKWKAQHLRELTGDERYKAEIEIRSETFMQRLGSALYRPFLLTATEPIIILIALYLTVVYIGKSKQPRHAIVHPLTTTQSSSPSSKATITSSPKSTEPPKGSQVSVSSVSSSASSPL